MAPEEGNVQDNRRPVSQLTGASPSPLEFRETANQIYAALQVVLEFMDKGMKGLLTGDLSVPLLLEIEKSIDRYEIKFNKLQTKMQGLAEKQETVDKFMSTHFQVGSLIAGEEGTSV